MLLWLERSAFVIACVTCCSCMALALAHATEQDLSHFFSSDMLYLPSLYRDLFRDGGSLAGWFLNPAPNFFPDMGLYFVLNALLGRFVLASYAYPMVQLVIIALLLRAIGRRTGLADDRAVALGILAMTLIVLAGIAGDFAFAIDMLVNSVHMGALVNALLCTWLALRLVERSTAARAVVFVLVVLVATVSDSLFWITFSVPVALACTVLALRMGRVPWLWIGGLTIAASALSVPLLGLYKGIGVGMIERPYAYMAFERVGHCWARFGEVMGQLLTWNKFTAILVGASLLTMVAVMVRGGLAVLREQVKGTSALPASAVMVRCMLGVFFPAVLFAPVLNGSFDGRDSIRYDYAVFPMALFIAGAWMAGRLGKQAGWIVLGVGGIGTFACLVGISQADGAVGRVWRYRPAIAQDVDVLADHLPAHNGVTGYWEAKVITMFSEKELVVLPTFPDLAGYVHVNRIGMFHRSIVPPEDPRRFSFVVLNNEPERERYVTKRWSGYYRLQHGATRVIVVPPFTYGDNIWHPEE